MNGRVKRLLHPYNIDVSDVTIESEPDPKLVAEIGPWISAALSDISVTSAISSSWKLHFREDSCLICDSCPTSISRFVQHSEVAESLLPPSVGSSSFSRHLKEIGPFLKPLGKDQPRMETGSLKRLRCCIKAFNRCRTPGSDVQPEVDSIAVNVEKGIRVDILHFFEFHLLRHLLLDNDSELIQSLRCTQPLVVKGGKSRSEFYETCDGRFIIKSLLSSELKNWEKKNVAFIWYYMNTIFHSYPSILVPFLGVFVVHTSVPTESRAYVVMRNMARLISGAITFDLKGMGPQRSKMSASVNERDPRCLGESIGTQEVLWDGDLRSIWNHEPILVDEQLLEYLRLSLDNDTMFLSALDSVDYSMILSYNRIGHAGSHTDSMSVGIVDYLRNFTWDKRLESVVKSINSNISAVRDRIPWRIGAQTQDSLQNYNLELEKAPTIINPDLYAKRFRNNIISLFQPWK